MAKIKCPNCSKTKRIEGRYDNCFDLQIKCDNCGVALPGFCWEYASSKKQEESKDFVLLGGK
jgi:hypothetical protein